MDTIYCNPEIAEELNKTYRLDDNISMSIDDLRTMFSIVENEKDPDSIYRAVLKFADDHNIPYDRKMRGKATFVMSDIYRRILKRSHIQFHLSEGLCTKLMRIIEESVVITTEEPQVEAVTDNVPDPPVRQKRKYTRHTENKTENAEPKKRGRKPNVIKDVSEIVPESVTETPATGNPPLSEYDWYKDAEALAVLFRTTAEKVVETAVERLRNDILGIKVQEENPFV